MHKQVLSAGFAIFFTMCSAFPVVSQTVITGGISNQASRTTEYAEWKKLSRPPADTIDAQNLRIWFAPRQDGNCRVRINVVDSAQTPRRQVLNKLLKQGYYNLYWDKRDDSGRLVEPGRYRYIATSGCGYRYEGKLTVSYRQWERALHLTPDTTGDSAVVVLQVDSSRIPVTMWVQTPDSVVVDTLCVSRAFPVGIHRLTWAPERQLALGEYVVRLTAGDYIAEERVILKWSNR
ncbi:MAG: hypothetical protein HY851_09590 [candidate division Zixibacteria bacterium]|nr:hypothetical protein [candidate division Zixibacteria bacterium]